MGRRAVEHDEHDERVGAYIRALRRHRGLTLVRLSEASGLSHSFLSQVERGRARPSRDSLQLIALALESSHAEIVAAASGQVALAEGDPAADQPHGRSRVLLQQRALFSAIEITYLDRAAGEFYHHPESELLYIVRGVAEVEIGDRSPVSYSAGASVFCPPGSRHRWRAIDSDGFTALLIKDDPLAK